jgi:hypothetical protein
VRRLKWGVVVRRELMGALGRRAPEDLEAENREGRPAVLSYLISVMRWLEVMTLATVASRSFRFTARSDRRVSRLCWSTAQPRARGDLRGLVTYSS